MNRRKKKITLRVGAFILTGIVLLFAYILLLGQNRTFFNFVTKYKVQLKKTDGLFTGSVVTVNGVPAGNVMAIDFIQETGDVKVVISILRRFTPVITDQSFAFLATKGLLGDKYIAITTRGQQQGKRLPKNSYIPSQAPPGMLGVLSHPRTGDKVSAILDELLTFTQSLNSEKTIKKAGKAMDRFSNTFSAKGEWSQILSRLNSILAKIDDGEGTAGALINNKNVYHRLLSLLGQKPYHKYLPSLLEEQKKPIDPDH